MNRSNIAAYISLVIIISVATLWIQFHNQAFYSCFIDDTTAYLNWTRQYNDAFAEGNFFPRWMPESHGGYGSPTFIFYPPLVTMLTAFILSISGDAILSMNLIKILGLALSGIFMFVFIRDTWGDKAGLAAAAAYMLLPYRIFDLYVLGVHSSRFVYVWFPLILYFVRKTVMDKGIGRPFAGLAVSYALLCSTHLLSGYMFAPVLFMFGVFSAGKGELRTAVARLMSAPVLGLLIAAAYLLPVVMETQLVHLELLTQTPKFFFWENYLFRVLGTQGGQVSQFNAAVGRVSLLSAGVAASYIILNRRTPTAKGIRDKLYFIGVAAACFFLASDVSGFLWSHVPGMEYLIYPGRWMSVMIFALACLAGVGFGRTAQNGGDASRTASLSLGIMLILVTVWADVTIISKSCMITHNEIQGLRKDYDLPEYVPADVPETWLDSSAALDPSARLTTVPSGHLTGMEIYRWASSERLFMVELDKAGLIRVRTFNYPGWKATVDGLPVEVSSEPGSGAILLPVPKGPHKVSLVFSDTDYRRLAKLVSLFAALLTAVIMFRPNRMPWSGSPGR